ncbi:hypothetical protein L484_007886 [Morus notabilis]|uniref:Uncharacterized protein n=1 Tax=Morus notabilis TaxID=981085 RepID=W9QR21_9ROSA|nr:hypothetical protein L484_007886 [Morus notabilis]
MPSSKDETEAVDPQGTVTEGSSCFALIIHVLLCHYIFNALLITISCAKKEIMPSKDFVSSKSFMRRKDARNKKFMRRRNKRSKNFVRCLSGKGSG